MPLALISRDNSLESAKGRDAAPPDRTETPLMESGAGRPVLREFLQRIYHVALAALPLRHPAPEAVGGVRT